jgi:hypothetical protein
LGRSAARHSAAEGAGGDGLLGSRCTPARRGARAPSAAHAPPPAAWLPPFARSLRHPLCLSLNSTPSLPHSPPLPSALSRHKAARDAPSGCAPGAGPAGFLAGRARRTGALAPSSSRFNT